MSARQHQMFPAGRCVWRKAAPSLSRTTATDGFTGEILFEFKPCTSPCGENSHARVRALFVSVPIRCEGVCEGVKVWKPLPYRWTVGSSPVRRRGARKSRASNAAFAMRQRVILFFNGPAGPGAADSSETCRRHTHTHCNGWLLLLLILYQHTYWFRDVNAAPVHAAERLEVTRFPRMTHALNTQRHKYITRWCWWRLQPPTREHEAPNSPWSLNKLDAASGVSDAVSARAPST